MAIPLDQAADNYTERSLRLSTAGHLDHKQRITCVLNVHALILIISNL
jgi:hypothetical protein